MEAGFDSTAHVHRWMTDVRSHRFDEDKEVTEAAAVKFAYLAALKEFLTTAMGTIKAQM